MFAMPPSANPCSIFAMVMMRAVRVESAAQSSSKHSLSFTRRDTTSVAAFSTE